MVNSIPDLNARIAALWTDSIDWITVHSAQIIVAIVLAAIVAAVLLATKWVGKRLVRKHADGAHWPQIIGGALSKIRLWFIAGVALQVVTTYSHAPTLHLRDNRTERLADWYDETKATTFAAWLRTQLGLPVVPV